MEFTKIDFETWERREYFEFFNGSTIYMTVKLDITKVYKELKDRKQRLYPTLIYCASKTFNDHEEFRYTRDSDGNLGFFDVIHPFYTVKRKDKPELFSMKCTEFDRDFSKFYGRFCEDYAEAEACGRLLCDGELPENIACFSAVPGVHYSAFSFSDGGKPDFAPYVLFGKYQWENGRLFLPVTGEFVHALQDGFHITRFFKETEEHLNRLFDQEQKDTKISPLSVRQRKERKGER